MNELLEQAAHQGSSAGGQSVLRFAAASAGRCDSSHITLMMPNERATPMPRIQLKYHIMCSCEFSFSYVCDAMGRTPQYIEWLFSSSAALVTLPRITRYTQLV